LPTRKRQNNKVSNCAKIGLINGLDVIPMTVPLEELFRITYANNIPSDWASPEQRCRAAIKAVGAVWSGDYFPQIGG
jgi:hypothetical protein